MKQREIRNYQSTSDGDRTLEKRCGEKKNPLTMVIDRSFVDVLDEYDGLLIREKLFTSQSACGVREKKSLFKVAPWTSKLPYRLMDEDFESTRRPLVEIREESAGGMPYGHYLCYNHRQAKFGVFPSSSSNHPVSSSSGWPVDSKEMPPPSMIIERPFRCCLPCCCMMLYPPVAYTKLLKETEPPEDDATYGTVGSVKMRWEWWNCIWPCLLRFDIFDQGNPNPIYVVEVPTACGRGCTNCCAPTCFHGVFSMPILESKTGRPVGELQNQWPGFNFRREMCQTNSGADNFVVKFPNGTTAQRATIISALMLINLTFFERRGTPK